MFGLSLILALSPLANAQEEKHALSLEARGEYQSLDADYSKTGARGDSRFVFNMARVTFTGPTGIDNQSYEMIVNYKGGTDGTVDDGNLNAAVETLNVSQDFGNDLSLTLGKFATYQGSNEWWYDDTDVYTYSSYGYANDINADGYDAGLHLAYTIADQELVFEIINADEGKTGVSSRFSYLASYRGNFMNGTIVPMITYGIFADTGNNIATQDKHLGLGVQLNVNSFTVELEHNSVTEEKQGSSNYSDVEGTSMVGLVRFNGENFRPFVKYISEEAKDKAADKITKDSYDLGLEWYPNKDSGSRWHLTYSSEDYDCKSANSSTTCTVNEKETTALADHTNTTIRIGYRLMFDIF